MNVCTLSPWSLIEGIACTMRIQLVKQKLIAVSWECYFWESMYTICWGYDYLSCLAIAIVSNLSQSETQTQWHYSVFTKCFQLYNKYLIANTRNKWNSWWIKFLTDPFFRDRKGVLIRKTKLPREKYQKT